MSYQEQPNPQHNDSVPVWDQVIEDMKARNELGKKRYGTALQANNGRDALVDLNEELLDGLAYLKQHMIEQRELWRDVKIIRDLIADIEYKIEPGNIQITSVNRQAVLHGFDRILNRLPPSIKPL